MDFVRQDSVSLREIRNVPETINATFDFLRLHRKPLFRSVLKRAFPILLVGNLLYTALIVFPASSIGSVELGQSVLNLLLWIASIFLGQSMLLAVVHAYVKLADKHGVDEFDEADVWVEAKSMFGSVISANVTMVVLFIVGFAGGSFVFGIIPFIGPFLMFSLALWLGVSWCLFYPSNLLEDYSFTESFTMSRYLVRGRWWATAGFVIVWGLMLYLLTAFFSVPSYLFSGMGDYLFGWDPVVTTGTPMRLLQSFASLLSSSLWQLAYVLPMVGLSMYFYNQLERKDGVSLADDVERIGVDIEHVSNSVGEGDQPGETPGTEEV